MPRTAVLITGGAGFIGSNLADAVVADGRACHVVDDLSTGQAIRVPGEAELHELDIRDGAALAAVAADAQPSVIFHLAAQADVRRAVEDPAFDADVNVIGTINVLEAARAVGARVVFASTGGAAYGEYEGLPVPTPETAATRPMSPYGASKIAAEGYCGVYGRLHGTEVNVLRFGNVYGPRQDPHAEAGVIAIFVGRVLDGLPPRVYGDGRQTRDYVYVGDVVRAFLAAETGPAGETINVGTGEESSVLDVIAALGWDGEIEFADRRAGELERSCLDPSRAAEVFGWRAEVSLREGLALTRASVLAARAAPERRPPGAFATA